MFGHWTLHILTFEPLSKTTSRALHLYQKYDYDFLIFIYTNFLNFELSNLKVLKPIS